MCPVDSSGSIFGIELVRNYVPYNFPQLNQDMLEDIKDGLDNKKLGKSRL
jgi:hypothetical protein